MSADTENPSSSSRNKFDEASSYPPEKSSGSGLSSMALMVLLFLAVQNCVKNIVMRAAVRGKANFLYSAAVIATEGLKCLASALWVLCIDRGSFASIFRYLRIEWRKTLLLMVPAGIYNFQKTLEYVALRNLNAAVFAVLVQTKLFTTAICAVGLMGKSLRRAQVISLVLLVVGCVLAQLDHSNSDCPTAITTDAGATTTEAAASSTTTTTDAVGSKFVGVVATLCIAFSSGFASVYTEKVIKAVDAASSSMSSASSSSGSGSTSDSINNASSNGSQAKSSKVESGLAYTQIQLAVASLVIEGLWAALTDFGAIQKHGLWYGFGWEAWLAVSMTALGGIAVAAVLKFADAILKGYATAISVVLTGLASHVLFGTVLNIEYGLGMINVIAAMVLYNSTNLNMRAF